MCYSVPEAYYLSARTLTATGCIHEESSVRILYTILAVDRNWESCDTALVSYSLQIAGVTVKAHRASQPQCRWQRSRWQGQIRTLCKDFGCREVVWLSEGE